MAKRRKKAKKGAPKKRRKAAPKKKKKAAKKKAKKRRKRQFFSFWPFIIMDGFFLGSKGIFIESQKNGVFFTPFFYYINIKTYRF